MRARSAALLLVAALAAAPAGVSQKATPGQVAYVEGVRAFDAGEYARAVERMRVALAEDSVEATARFRYKAQNAEDYFPHLWLGLSLEKTGDVAGARAALRESERQGAVSARPATRRILAAALARLAPPAPVPPTAVPVAEPVPAATPQPETPALVPFPTVAAVAPAQPAPTPLPARATLPSPPSPAAAGTPAAVTVGVRAFFRGEYDGAERLLAPEAGHSPVARLYLAFSLGGRYLLARPRDEAVLSRARAEYAAALLAGAPPAPGPWVSPAIAGLFDAAGAAR